MYPCHNLNPCWFDQYNCIGVVQLSSQKALWGMDAAEKLTEKVRVHINVSIHNLLMNDKLCSICISSYEANNIFRGLVEIISCLSASLNSSQAAPASTNDHYQDEQKINIFLFLTRETLRVVSNERSLQKD